MATNFENTTYLPSRQPDFFTQLLFTNKTAQHVKVLEDVKYQTYINTASIEDDVLQSDSGDCGWTPSGEVKFSERLLTVKRFKVNMEDCLDKLDREWVNMFLNSGAKITEMPTEIEDRVLWLTGLKLSRNIEKRIWNGVESATEIDGFITLLDNASDTIKVSGVTLTRANVLGEFEKVLMAQSEDVINVVDAEVSQLKFFTSPATHLLLKLALQDVNNSNIIINQAWTKEGENIAYMGYEIVPIQAIPKNIIVFAVASNLVYGSDLISDETSLRTGLFAAPLDNKYFVDGVLKIGVQVAFPNEIVLYK